MAKSLREIKRERPSAPERVDRMKRALLLENALQELRERRGARQSAVAQRLGTSRPNVSRIEQEADIRLSTLARYVEALGGNLEIRAVFDDETVRLVGSDSDSAADQNAG
jgi:transcriptional regulator with XRE-family HTH domain